MKQTASARKGLAVFSWRQEFVQQKFSAKHSLFYEAFSLLVQQKIAPSALDFKRPSGLLFTWHVDPVL
jgi:hypothetical protein